MPSLLRAFVCRYVVRALTGANHIAPRGPLKRRAHESRVLCARGSTFVAYLHLLSRYDMKLEVRKMK